MARQMMQMGFTQVGVLLGGLDAWRESHEVESIEAAAPAAAG